MANTRFGFLAVVVICLTFVSVLVGLNQSQDKGGELTYAAFSGELLDAVSVVDFEPLPADGESCLPAVGPPGAAMVDECPNRAQHAELFADTEKPQRIIKVMFWVDLYQYTHMMSRFVPGLYEAARIDPGWDAYLYGPGLPGHREICYCTPRVGHEAKVGHRPRGADGREIVQCVSDGDNGRYNFRAAQKDAKKAKRKDETARGVKKEDLERCDVFELLSFADQLKYLFRADEKPFDMIVSFRMLRGEHYMRGISDYTRRVLINFEWSNDLTSLIRKFKPHVATTTYVDLFEEGHPLRAWTREQYRTVQHAGAKLLLVNDTLGPDVAEPNFVKDIGYEQTLLQFAPYATIPHCHTDWRSHVNVNDDDDSLVKHVSSVAADADSPEPSLRGLGNPGDAVEDIKARMEASSEKRVFDINLVGNLEHKMYPTRDMLWRIYENDIRGLKSRIGVLSHPGYLNLPSHSYPSDRNCTEFLEDTLDRYGTYIEMMERSKICFVGIVGTWAVRKFHEAMGSGCLVVGDVPADFAYKEHIINLNATFPGVYNRREGLDMDAVLQLVGKNMTVAQAVVPVEPSYTPLVKMNRTEDVLGIFADRLLEILEDYNRGAYDEHIERARKFALRENSASRFLNDWLLPAVDAQRDGERGWLRTADYIRYRGRKYETRHRYILSEWLLRKRGLGLRVTKGNDNARKRRQAEMAEYLSMPYEALLDRAEDVLAAQYAQKCERLGVCEPRGAWYYDGITDFDAKFVAARQLYLSSAALDTVTQQKRFAGFMYEDTEQLITLLKSK